MKSRAWVWARTELTPSECGVITRMPRCRWRWPSKNAKMPLEVAKRNAVHAVIFKGVPAGNGAASQPPLKTDAVTASDSVFFGNFFQGEYQDYINSVASGSLRILKLRAREYKIGYVVSVAKDNLRKYLEDQGVIKGLSSGF